ncbi:MAG: hypothetical protein WDK95_14440 [Syntrophorhabdaceae bacterium]
MKVTLNVTMKKLFSLVAIGITGTLNINTGGEIVANLVKKKIVNGLRNNNMHGSVIIDGETFRV